MGKWADDCQYGRGGLASSEVMLIPPNINVDICLNVQLELYFYMKAVKTNANQLLVF